MSPLLDNLRANLAIAESRLAYARYVSLNSESREEALSFNDQAARLEREIAELHERIKATNANEQRARR